MAVKDQLNLIERGPGSASEKARARTALKVRENVAAAKRLVRKPFIVEGVRWDILAAEERERKGVPFVRIVAEAYRGNEKLVSAGDFANPFEIFNPPILVPDREEPNPAHNPEDPRSGPPTVTVFREDLEEVIRRTFATFTRALGHAD